MPATYHKQDICHSNQPHPHPPLIPHEALHFDGLKKSIIIIVIHSNGDGSEGGGEIISPLMKGKSDPHATDRRKTDFTNPFLSSSPLFRPIDPPSRSPFFQSHMRPTAVLYIQGGEGWRRGEFLSSRDHGTGWTKCKTKSCFPPFFIPPF